MQESIIIAPWRFCAVIFAFVSLVLGVSPAFAQVCYNKLTLDLSYEGSVCSSTPASPPSIATNCTATLQVAPSYCRTVYTVCCDDSILSYEDSTSISETITGVALGGEYDAAVVAFTSFKSTHPFPAAQAGYTMVGSLEGSAYSSRLATDGATAELDFVAWRRGNYVKIGDNSTTVPLESLSGTTGSGSSINYDTLKQKFVEAMQTPSLNGMKQAVEDGLTSKLGAANIKAAMKEALTEASGGGWSTSGGGGSGGPWYTNSMTFTTTIDNTSLQQIGQASGSGMSNYFQGLSVGTRTINDGSGHGGYGDNNTLGQSSSDYTNYFSDFVNTTKQSALFALPNQLSGFIPAGGASSISFNAGMYGSHTFDFSTYASIFTTIKYFLLSAFTFVGIRIVTLKG